MTDSDDQREQSGSSVSGEGSSPRSTDQDTSGAQPNEPAGPSTQPDPISPSSSGTAASTANAAKEALESGDCAKKRMEVSSLERTQSLKAARDAALNQPLPQASSASSSMDFPPDSAFPLPQTYPPTNLYPPAPSFPPFHNGQRRDHSGLINGLQRLGFILSLVLGSSAVIGLFWSTFILPLLHSSFSARQVLLEQQLPRFEALLNGLKALRISPLFPITPRDQEVENGVENQVEDRKRIDAAEHKSGIEEISTSESSKSGRSHSDRRLLDDISTEKSASVLPLLPLEDLSTLSASLRSLSSAITSTSTTRVSLLSTLETYTSQLHREVYLRTDHSSAFSVGLGSLSQNLANAAGSKASGSMSKNASSEWDDVRKEIRAIKGLLLGRRNFMPQTVHS